MSDGFLDFSMDSGDDTIGKKSTRFKAESDRTYRVTFCWFSVHGADGWDDNAAFNKDGTLNPDATIRYTGCERIYKPGVGYFLYKGPAYAQFGTPKQNIATILVVWPTDKDGDLDATSFKAGKGWKVQPWVFSGDKYNTIKKSNKRFPLLGHDLAMSCTDAQYQKMTFSPEGENLLQKMLESDKPEIKATLAKILSDIKSVAANINRDLARDLTVDQIKEALGEEVDSPTGGSNHASQNVDDLLDGVL
jgi:hypothetical protein